MKQEKTKLTKAQEKTVKKLIRSQEYIKGYFLFPSEAAKKKWVPPLSFAEESCTTGAQSRFLRLMKFLVNKRFYYIASKGRQDIDLYKRTADKFDRYIVNRTSISMVYEDGTYKDAALPIVIPMIYTQQKYKINEMDEPGILPTIILKRDGESKFVKISLNELMRMKQVLAILYSIPNDLKFFDFMIDYVLGFIKVDLFIDLVSEQVKNILTEKFPNAPDVSMSTIRYSMIWLMNADSQYKPCEPYINLTTDKPALPELLDRPNSINDIINQGFHPEVIYPKDGGVPSTVLVRDKPSKE